MNIKKALARLISGYCVLVTLITAVIFLLGMGFAPGVQMGYSAYISPFIFAAMGMLPEVVMYSRREMSSREFLFRKALQLLLIEGFVLTFVSRHVEIPGSRSAALLGLGAAIVAVFVLAHAIEWLLSCLSAKEMTQQLEAYKRRTEEEESAL